MGFSISQDWYYGDKKIYLEASFKIGWGVDVFLGGKTALSATAGIGGIQAGIVDKSDEIEYGYTDSAWGDLLTSFNGSAITYDEIGNPLSYYNGAVFSWTGRQLTGASYGGNTYTFTYNDAGVRQTKVKNGVTTTFYYDGNTLIAEETAGNITMYLYDAQGSPIGFRYRSASYTTDQWDVYWYGKNLQGDITEIYSNAGVKLLAYNYSAWGNPTIIEYNGGKSTTAVNNHLTYRGYYYDTDLGLYYLISRYYDAITGRFISADGLVSTGQGFTGYNMFAYCGNNPISRIDFTGMFWKEAKEFISNAWTQIKTWANNTFGAGCSSTLTIEENATHTIPDPSPITVTTGTQTTQTVLELGDTSKPVSVYANHDVQDPVKSSSAGLIININNFTLDSRLGLDDISLSGLFTYYDTTNAFGIKLNLSEFKIGFEASSTIQWDNTTETSYTNFSVSGWAILAAYFLVTTGQYVPSPSCP